MTHLHNSELMFSRCSPDVFKLLPVLTLVSVFCIFISFSLLTLIP